MDNVATVTIPVDEYFELRMKADQHSELMRYFVETQDNFRRLWDEVNILHNDINKLRIK